MTGFGKAIIAITIVGLLAAIIGTTWYLTKRSLVKALTPPTLPTQQTTQSQTSDQTTATQESKTQEETTAASNKVLIPIVKGWNFKTVPFILSPNKGQTVFSRLSSGDAYYLDAAKQSYISFLESGEVSPGQGLALRSESGEVLELVVNAATAVDETRSFIVPLKTGWNLVGNPFNKDITWNPTLDTGSQKLSLEKAIEQNVVSKTYAWSPSAESYLVVGPNQTVKKFQAVFIKSGGSAKLIINSE